MRRLGESEVGPCPTAIETEWVPLFIRFGHGCRWTQQVRRLGATQCSIIFNSSRCGHVNMVIDPSAFKENVASGMGFFLSRSWQNSSSGSKAERYERGLSLLLMRSSVFEGHGVSKTNRIQGGGWPLEPISRSYTGRARLSYVRPSAGEIKGCTFDKWPAPFQRSLG
jgi:hypothetical protein